LEEQKNIWALDKAIKYCGLDTTVYQVWDRIPQRDQGAACGRLKEAFACTEWEDPMLLEVALRLCSTRNSMYSTCEPTSAMQFHPIIQSELCSALLFRYSPDTMAMEIATLAVTLPCE
jgi:hypothetical protein